MKRQVPYRAPEGYFEDLQQRLSAIPGKEQQPSAWQKVTPYLALAAVFAAAFIAGNFLVSKTTVPQATSEEVIEYLMNSDISLAQLEEAIYFSE